MTEPASCFTIVARNYLGYAITLGQSLGALHPNFRFAIVVVDGLDGIDASSIPFTVLDARDVCDEHYPDMAFRYNVVEFATSIKPQVFRHFMQAHGGVVLYLDPDLFVLGPLDPIVEALRDKSICVTPHLIHCKLDDEPYPEYLHLFEGVFNFGFCGVRGSPDAVRFLDWWDRQLRNHCYIDHRDGLHTDQKWANYLPCYFGDSLVVLRHPGANVAHWNLGERSVSVEDGTYFVNGQRLLFFHFSGFDYFGKGLVKRGSVETGVAGHDTALRQLAAAYRARLKANGHEAYARLAYAFDRFPNGDLVTHLHRRLYRASGGHLADPFVDFHGPVARARLIDRSPIAAAGYRRAAVADVEGKTRRLEALFRLALRALGVRRYNLLIKACNHFGRHENHGFLLGAERSADVRAGSPSSKPTRRSTTA